MDSNTPLKGVSESICSVRILLGGSLNPSAVLEFSKMYKFIVKFVIFSIAGVTQLKTTK